jgi:NhaP-type Na+/H+ or K+/H+ antiporter
MRWDSEGYGRSKGISGSLIAACTFDNITCLILFGVCKTVAFQYAAETKGTKSHSNPAWAIGSIFVHNIAGIIAGVLMGLVGWLFKFIEHKSYSINLKCAYTLIISIGLIIASEESTFKNAKYIACLSFGYTCFRVWGEKKPAKQIADCWFYIQPFLFGTIGAALLFTQVRAKDVGSSFILIFSG